MSDIVHRLRGLAGELKETARTARISGRRLVPHYLIVRRRRGPYYVGSNGEE